MYTCTESLLKRGYSKRKECAPSGNGRKLFPFRVDPFTEGSQNYLQDLPHLKAYPFTLNTNELSFFKGGQLL